MGSKKAKRGILHSAVPLNALALGVAVAGFLLPLYTQSPTMLVDDAQSMLAGTGEALSASVPPNPYNTLADQLAQKEQALNEREASLNARAATPSLGDIFGFVSFALSVILCGLVAMNFYLDSRRNRKRGAIAGRYSVDLS